MDNLNGGGCVLFCGENLFWGERVHDNITYMFTQVNLLMQE